MANNGSFNGYPPPYPVNGGSMPLAAPAPVSMPQYGWNQTSNANPHQQNLHPWGGAHAGNPYPMPPTNHLGLAGGYGGNAGLMSVSNNFGGSSAVHGGMAPPVTSSYGSAGPMPPTNFFGNSSAVNGGNAGPSPNNFGGSSAPPMSPTTNFSGTSTVHGVNNPAASMPFGLGPDTLGGSSAPGTKGPATLPVFGGGSAPPYSGGNAASVPFGLGADKLGGFGLGQNAGPPVTSGQIFTSQTGPLPPHTAGMPTMPTNFGYGVSGNTNPSGMPQMPGGFGGGLNMQGSIPSAPSMNSPAFANFGGGMPPTIQMPRGPPGSTNFGGGTGIYGSNTGPIPAMPMPRNMNLGSANGNALPYPGAGGMQMPGVGGLERGISQVPNSFGPPNGRSGSLAINCVHCTLLNPSHRELCEACERSIRG